MSQESGRVLSILPSNTKVIIPSLAIEAGNRLKIGLILNKLLLGVVFLGIIRSLTWVGERKWLVSECSKRLVFSHWLLRPVLRQIADHSEFILDISIRLIILDSWSLKTWPIGCPETSERNYQHTLRTVAERRISHIIQVEAWNHALYSVWTQVMHVSQTR